MYSLESRSSSEFALALSIEEEPPQFAHAQFESVCGLLFDEGTANHIVCSDYFIKGPKIRGEIILKRISCLVLMV